jgi:LysM repeat protein
LKIHIVKKGDTLYDLAQKYHIGLDKLIASNPHIVNPDQIEVGMKVKIPASPVPMEPAEGTYKFKHVVKQGDTLWKLSKAWDVPLADLVAANPQLKNPNVLLTGETVYIPKSAPGVKAPPGPVTQPAAEQPASVAAEQPNPAPPWASEAPGPQSFAAPEWPGLNAGAAAEGHGLKAENLPEPQQSPGMQEPAEAFDSKAGWPENDWTSGPSASSMPQAPLLTEPFAGVQGWEPQTAHPFAQANIPATEAFAQQQPELPQTPNQPFDDYMHQYGSYPYLAGPEAGGPPYDLALAPYPYAYSNDCCSGPKLNIPSLYGGYGAYGAYGPSSLPYAAPLSAPYGTGQAMPHGQAQSVSQYDSVPPAHSYGDIPLYPEETDAVKLEAEKEDLDITLNGGRSGAKTKSVSPRKRPKPPSQREQLAVYLRKARRRAPEMPEPRANVPWINV